MAKIAHLGTSCCCILRKKTEHMEKAKHPAYLLRGSLVSPSLEAGIITGKYANASSLAWLEGLYHQYDMYRSPNRTWQIVQYSVQK